METQIEKKTWKQKLFQEFSDYLFNVIYLTIFFGVFAISRRLTLAHYNIILDDYFIGLIKALVIGKVIMLASFLRISNYFQGRALMIPVMYKVFIFVLWVIFFDAAEGLIRGLIQTHSMQMAFDNLIDHHFSKMWLGGLLMVFLSFIPFFALKELSRIIGPERFRNLFFRAGTVI